MRGQAGRPIWIMITLLLALLVGIMMYQLLQKTRATKTFEDWQREIGAGQAEILLTQICERWYENSFKFGVTRTDIEKATVAAVELGYFTREEWDDGERLSPCDCVVYLYKKGRVPEYEAKNFVDQYMLECHEKALEVAEELR